MRTGREEGAEGGEGEAAVDVVGALLATQPAEPVTRKEAGRAAVGVVSVYVDKDVHERVAVGRLCEGGVRPRGGVVDRVRGQAAVVQVGRGPGGEDLAAEGQRGRQFKRRCWGGGVARALLGAAAVTASKRGRGDVCVR